MKVQRWIVSGIAYSVLWVFVTGPALTVASLLGSLLIGLAVGLLIAYTFRRFNTDEVDPLRLLAAIPDVIRYVLAFVKEIVVANVDVAYRVLSPRMPMEPQVIYIPLRVQTAIGVTTIANSITITPGTVTLDHDPDENALYVHIIDGRNPREVVEPIRQWEDYALAIFDEERSPKDPAPEIRVHPPDHPPEPKTVRVVHPHDRRARSGEDEQSESSDRADDATERKQIDDETGGDSDDS